MAANFGDTLPQGELAPEAVVQEPVVNRGIERAAGLLQNTAQTVGYQAGSMFGGNALQGRASFLSSLQTKWLDYADAVEQGSLDPSQARIMMRADFREAVANDPTAFNDINKLHSDIVGASGLGHIIQEGTPEDKAEAQLRQEAADNQMTLDQYKRLKVAEANVRVLTSTYNQMSIEGKTADEVQIAEGRTAIAALGDAAYPKAQAIFAQGKERIAAGEDRAVVAADVEQQLNMLTSDYAAVAGKFDADYLIAPITSLRDSFLKFAKGETELAVFEGTEKVAQAQIKQNMLVQNPGLRNALAATSFFKDIQVPPELLQTIYQNIGLADSMAKAFQSPDQLVGGSPADMPPAVGKDGNTTGYLQTLRELIKNSDAVSEDTAAEYMNAINNAVNGVYTQSTGVKDPTAFREVVELLGNPAVRDFVQKNGGISAEFASAAANTINTQYTQAFIPAVNKAWNGTVPLINTGNLAAARTGVVNAGQNVPMSEVLVPQWNGSAVEFIPAPGYEGNGEILNLANVTNSGNTSIGIPLNNLINAEATLTGADPKQIWEQKYAGFFGQGEGERDNQPATNTSPRGAVDQLGKGDTPTQLKALAQIDPKTLTLDQFNSEDIEIAKDKAQAVVENTSAADPTAVTNASNPVEFAQAYIGKGEVEDNKALSAFIKQSAGLDLNPAKTAWCAAFVDAVLHATGSKGTGKLNARSYLNWGVPVDEPKVGDVVVLERGGAGSWQGHVGFYAGNGKILAGNQGDEVSVIPFDEDKVLGYRRASNA